MAVEYRRERSRTLPNTGTRIGPYEILSPLGSGGMGDVYRARDLRLRRDVAVKVLPDRFALDGSRLERLRSEAQLLASLNHVNIATIHGIEELDGCVAIILELVEGETLADRIARGAIPRGEALSIAKQIAAGLEATHHHGVVHRDLKPSNVKLRPDGTAKILDFGLAKAFDAAEPVEAQAQTMTMPRTQVGVVLGTAAYMSPEQAQALPIDTRTDVWAFGCVLFEMLTGHRAFAGQTASEMLASLLTREPDWTLLPADTSAPIRRLVQRCLEKDPRRRLQAIGDARIEIDDALELRDEAAEPVRQSRGLPWLLLTGAALVIVGASSLGPYFRDTSDQVRQVRFEVVTPPTTATESFALSADGRTLAFVATADGAPRLWVRSLDSVTARLLPGTHGASYPFWAPDNTAIGFFADGSLKRIDADGSSIQVLADAPNGRGGAWSRDGAILFAPTNQMGGVRSVLMRVAASGGTAEPATHLLPGHLNHRFPQFLPNGRRFLFLSLDGKERGTYIGSLDGGEPVRVTDDNAAAEFAPPGTLLLVRQGVLVAIPFDHARAVVTGPPVPVISSVTSGLGDGRDAFSVSADGVLVYRADSTPRRQLVWVDRSGVMRGTFYASDDHRLANPELSPDGKSVAVTRATQGNTDIWLIDSGGPPRRLTFDNRFNGMPLWSADGERVSFSAPRTDRDGTHLFEQAATGAGGAELLLTLGEDVRPQSWSREGVLLYSVHDPETGADLWALPTGREPPQQCGAQPTGDANPFIVLQTPFDEGGAQFSPDGAWIAYESNERGRVEVYVRPYPCPGGTWQISSSGGSRPRWRHDGKELFFLAPDDRLMAVPIAVTGDGTALAPGVPVSLFQTRLASGVGISFASGLAKPQYAVAPDGRFLMNVAIDEAAVPPITVVVSWQAASKP